VDLIFAPEAAELYPRGFKTYVDMADLPEVLCGQSRPGHFRGVMTVVTKLFNIVEPDIAYFGQKDYQQALIIKQMVRDLNQNLLIKVLPIVREKDGLAMSSRNRYLTPAERTKASCLYQVIRQAETLIRRGEYSSNKIIRKMRYAISRVKGVRIDYIAIVDPTTLAPLKEIKTKSRRGGILVALAVFIGKTRLIDNILIDRL
jgi:pantoate--beta-alanine ligase